jgi:hypothetical protein
VIDSAVYFTALLALLLGVHKLWTVRTGDANPQTRHQVLFALCISGHFALAAPATIDFTQRLGESYAGLLSMFDDELRTAAIHFFAMLALALLPEGEDRQRAERRQRRIAAATMTAAAILFLAADVHGAGTALVVHGLGVPALATYDALLAGYAAWCLGTTGLGIARYARRVEPGMLRFGAGLLVAAAVVGVVWAVWNLHEVQSVLHLRRGEGDADTADAVIGSLSVVLGLSGAALLIGYGPARDPGRWLRSYRQYRALEHLWSVLRTAVPGIVLDAGGRRHVPGLPLDAEFMLQRRVIEIYDGRLALRPYFDPRVPDWTAEHEGDAAVVEAAVIAAAIEAAKAGRRVGEENAAPSAALTDLHSADDEVAWLIQVAEAFGSSPVVAQVRDLVRAESAV